MLRRILTTLSICALALLAVESGLAEDFKLRLAHTAPVNSAPHKWTVQFAESLKGLSGGSLQTTILGGGVLGTEAQQLAQGRAGKLDLWVLDPVGAMMAKEGRDFTVLFAPFLFRDQDHYRKFLASSLFREMMTDAEGKISIKFLGLLGDRAPRALATRKRPVRTPEDLKGLKIRVPRLPFIASLWQEWGASPTPLSGSDLYQALQSGLVDGDDNGIDILIERGLAEVEKYYTPLDYVHSGIGLFMSGATWARLSEQQRGWALQSAKMVDAAQKPYAATLAAYIAAARAKGVTVVEPDRTRFRTIAAEIVARHDGQDWTKGLYQKIQAVR